MKTLKKNRQSINSTKSKIELKKTIAKGSLAAALLLTSLTTISNEVSAASAPTASYKAVSVKLNNGTISFQDKPFVVNGTTYVPLREIAEKYGAQVFWDESTRMATIKQQNQVISFSLDGDKADVNGKTVAMKKPLVVNQRTFVPIRFLSESMGLYVSWVNNTGTVLISDSQIPASIYEYNYSVLQNDTLWIIAKKYKTTIERLMRDNNLTTETIQKGQQLIVRTPVAQPTPAPKQNSVKNVAYTIKGSDNWWNLSIRFGIPQHELLKVNGATENTILYTGQTIKIPVHTIAVKPTKGPNAGELLDWWTEAQYVVPINTVFKVTDVKTGRSFMVKRTIGANHADCEPLTSQDTAIAKQVWGGFNWNTRAVLVETKGRKLAASMSFMPHSIEYIKDNNFTGHFDIHFKNSTRHKDGLIDTYHQDQILIAAGVKRI